MPPVKGTRFQDSGVQNKWALFAFGTIFLTGLIAIALLDREPSQTSWYIYNCVLAISAGGVAALLPGTISLDWYPNLKAGGALAVAVLVFLGGHNLQKPRARVEDLKSFLMFDRIPLAANPNTSDVYVVVNWKVVKSDVVSGAQDLKIGDPVRGKEVSILRGTGGIHVDFKSLFQGENIFVAVHDGGFWWKSNDMTIPDTQLEMGEVPFESIEHRVNQK